MISQKMYTMKTLTNTVSNFKFLYYAKVQNANQQATDDGLSDRNVTSDVHVRTANYSTRYSERPDR